MERLIGWTRADARGFTNVIPEFLGTVTGDDPVFEVWFDAHPNGPTLLTGGQTLARYTSGDPKRAPSGGLLYAFGPTLPCLAKIITPAQALSLQVHPTKGITREGRLCGEVLGIGRTDTRRVHRDMNHKPEMTYMLTESSTLAGLRTPRKTRRLSTGLGGDLVDRLRYRLKLSTVCRDLHSLAM